MDTLGEDLLLLAIHPGNGSTTSALRYGLAGSELVRLAAAQRVDVVSGRVTLLGQQPWPTGDPLLDTALASIEGARRPPHAKTWVGHPRPGIVQQYIERLAAAGAIRQEARRALGITWSRPLRVEDQARLTDARGRFDAVVRGIVPLDNTARAYAGLGFAIGLGHRLYPGRDGSEARKRLEKIAKPDRRSRTPEDEAIRAVRNAVRSATDASTQAATDAATQAAIHSSIHAATQAAVDAATQAAIQASVDAATHAAIDAAVHAAVDASVSAAQAGAGHDGGAGGGHH